jgi:hypothetical protein
MMLGRPGVISQRGEVQRNAFRVRRGGGPGMRIDNLEVIDTALPRPVFDEARTPEGFAKVTLDEETGTVVCPGGADLAPDTLYERVRTGALPDSRVTARAKWERVGHDVSAGLGATGLGTMVRLFLSRAASGRSPGCPPGGGGHPGHSGTPAPTPLGLPDELVGEKDEAVTNGLGIDEAHGLLVARLAEEALAGPEHDWEDDHPQFVDQVMLDQRAPELIAGRDDDFSV